jgi:hypothetical protein
LPWYKKNKIITIVSLRLFFRTNSNNDFDTGEGIRDMINSEIASRLAALTISAALSVAMNTLALAQAPTDAQRNAIRSACRADYEAHCASVPPGGAASLQCLQKNMQSLSSNCQTAVRAVDTAAAPKAEATPKTKPAAAGAKPAAESPAPKEAATTNATKQPSNAQISAVRTACRSDYMKVCSGVPTGGAPALQCLEKNKAKVSTSCQQAVNAASGGGEAAAPTGAAAAAATTAPAALVLRPLRPREELKVLRSACGGDAQTLCSGVAAGGGRIAQCLASNASSLSPACKSVLGQFVSR